MSARLLGPAELVSALTDSVERSWAARVCAEVLGQPQSPIVCQLRPGTSTAAGVRAIPVEAWTEWGIGWTRTDVSDLTDVHVRRDRLVVAGHPRLVPTTITIDTFDAALTLIAMIDDASAPPAIARARSVAARLHDAGAVLTSSILKAVCKLEDRDVDAVVSTVRWLGAHRDLSFMTIRQLPIPLVDTKWLTGHATLIQRLTARDVIGETRPRLSVVHVTYLDPAYLAGGGRRHDAWTSGDTHGLAYPPRTVLVVENRDPRLWFPELDSAVVVEGGGKAAAASLREIPWLVGAERVVYWGDIDIDGFEILNAFRDEMRARGVGVDSILMDAVSLDRYAWLGVNHDKEGRPLGPSKRRLGALTPTEREAFERVATAGPARFRRIEQERIPEADAWSALTALCASPRG